MLARKYAFMGYTLAGFYGIVTGILLMTCAGPISGVFTEVPEVLAPLKYQIILMGICTFFAGNGAAGATMWRTINKAGYYSYMMLANQVLLSTSISAFGLFYFGWGAAGPAYGFIASWISTYFFTVWYMTKRVDWNTVGAK